MIDGNYWDLVMLVHRALAAHAARESYKHGGGWNKTLYHVRQADAAWEKSFDFLRYLEYCEASPDED